MGKTTGFLEFERELPKKEATNNRIKHYHEFIESFNEAALNKQSARCMDCGIPFCHSGCPLGNVIPDFNDAVYNGKWETAYEILTSTNNFPEFTGRICPAPCESACVLGINKNPVTIEEIEKHIIEIAFKKGYVKPNTPLQKTGKKIAIVGSGPAGLAAADQLNKAGHEVTVFERDDKIGGLLRYGIPDFKLEKSIIDRRIEIMEQSGVEFCTNIEIGKNYSVDLLKAFDAVVLATGSTVPWHLEIPGSDAKGVHYAMDFLKQQNKIIGNSPFTEEQIIATDKHIVIIGDGDTGSDCVGTSNRQGAKSIVQIARKPIPTKERLKNNPWPLDKVTFSTSSSQEEGCTRLWATETLAFLTDENNTLKGVRIKEIQYKVDEFGNRTKLGENDPKEISADLVLLAVGYKHTEQNVLQQLNIQTDNRGNILATEQKYQTNVEHIFAAGDSRRGQSLVVWAISEGRECARKVDEFLMGRSDLESKESLHSQFA